MLSSPDDLTPDLLTEILSRDNPEKAGVVASFRLEPISGEFGKSHRLFRVRVDYTGAGSASHPRQFFLKFGRSPKEVFFYESIAPSLTSPPLLHCYYAAHNPEVDEYCLLLEDLSQTHYQTEWPLPPPGPLCMRIVQELGKIHARWWEHPDLESRFMPVIPTGRSWRERRALAREKLPNFLSFLGDRLSTPRREIFERLLASPPSWWEPAPGAPHQTLLHGDLHSWNVFFPRDPRGSLYFFDWNMWDTGCPTDDLAYMIAVHWYPERRGRMERDLLEAYFDSLTSSGGKDYTWGNLEHDYRASVVRSLFIPVWQWVRGIQPGVWWPHLERVFLAFEDLDCATILADIR